MRGIHIVVIIDYLFAWKEKKLRDLTLNVWKKEKVVTMHCGKKELTVRISPFLS